MITLRPEQPQDEEAIFKLNRDVFIQAGDTGSEGKLVNALRQNDAITLSLVAVENDAIIGHILFSPVEVRSDSKTVDAIALGPVAVETSKQKQGIGAQLIEAGLNQCRELGHKLIFLLGHPDYYPRFGFQPTQQFGIHCEFDVPPEAFMVFELAPGALDDVHGIVHYRPEFKDV